MDNWVTYIMHIEEPRQNLLDAQQTLQSLKLFIEYPGPEVIPPCSGCQDHSASACSPQCHDAKTALSSHPDEFPIEPNIVPLVYGLASTRVTQTCWSCEGHMDSENRLIRLPSVSYYTSSPVYSQLLQRHLTNLSMDKLLAYQWQVVLSDFSQTWGITYSIMPNLNLETKDIRLGSLQNDLKIIAKDLQYKLKVIARQMLMDLDAWLAKQHHK
jgi:hypothetical protein